MIELEIAGRPVSLNDVTYRQHGLGGRKSFPRSPFSLMVDAPDFKTRALPIYRDLIEELKRDDALTGEFDPPYEGALRYPTFEEMLVLPPQLKMRMVNVYLTWDFLELYLTEENPDPACKWLVLNEFEDVFEADGCIIFQGHVVPMTLSVGGVES